MKEILATLYQSSLAPIDESEIIHVPDLANMAPNLHDFMRYEFWEGEPVVPPKLQFHVSGGQFHIGLSDSERERTCRFPCDGISSGIDMLEGYIRAGALQIHFRDWPTKVRKKGKNDAPSSKRNGTSTRTSGSTSSKKRTGTKAK